jgi:DNA mismatch repair protein MutH
MEREAAIILLKQLEGVDLRPLADHHQLTVWNGGRKNKGWAGHVIERHLGLSINSLQAPDCGSWELKIVPLKRDHNGNLRVKETMAITMIHPENVERTPFEESHLLAKLRKTVVCARVFESQQDARSLLFSVASFDLDDPVILAQVRSDYELVRETIRTKGFSALTGAMGVLVQPRTKGPGHGSISRAFYARTGFVTKILGMAD